MLTFGNQSSGNMKINAFSRQGDMIETQRGPCINTFKKVEKSFVILASKEIWDWLEKLSHSETSTASWDKINYAF